MSNQTQPVQASQKPKPEDHTFWLRAIFIALIVLGLISFIELHSIATNTYNTCVVIDHASGNSSNC